MGAARAALFTHPYRGPLQSLRQWSNRIHALRRIGIHPGVEERSLTLCCGADADDRVTRLLGEPAWQPRRSFTFTPPALVSAGR